MQSRNEKGTRYTIVPSSGEEDRPLTAEKTKTEGPEPAYPPANERVLVVYSPAGGNGKSEITANIAFHLARNGYRIWVIDANTHAPALDLILCTRFDARQGLTDLLRDPSMATFPVSPVVVPPGNGGAAGTLLFTPAGRSDVSVQTLLSEARWGDAEIERVQDALIATMDNQKIDLCIIDTHQGFDLINRIWLGITSHLMIVSRLNDLDLRNLRVFLEDTSLAEIGNTLLVFNNVHVAMGDAGAQRSRGIERDLRDEVVTERMEAIINGESLLNHIGWETDRIKSRNGCLEVFPHAFLYSPQLVRYQQEGPRLGLFSEVFPSDPFSLTVRECADHLMVDWFNRRQ